MKDMAESAGEFEQQADSSRHHIGFQKESKVLREVCSISSDMVVCTAIVVIIRLQKPQLLWSSLAGRTHNFLL